MVGKYLLIKTEIATGVRGSGGRYYVFEIYEKFKNLREQIDLATRISKALNLSLKDSVDMLTSIDTSDTKKFYISAKSKNYASAKFDISQWLIKTNLKAKQNIKANVLVDNYAIVFNSKALTNFVLTIAHENQLYYIYIDEILGKLGSYLSQKLSYSKNARIKISLNQLNCRSYFITEYAIADLDYWNKFNLQTINDFTLMQMQKKQNI